MQLTRIHCPLCGHVQEIEVPQDKCLPFYKCEGCGELVQASEDSCCVVCSYAETKCPVSHVKV